MSRWTSPAAAAAASRATSTPTVAASADVNAGSRDRGLEVHAVDVFHDEERRVVIHVDVEDVDDVGMIDGGGGARFANESLPGR